MLSFIVPAYNEELELPATLSAIHAAATANSEPYEIIVVERWLDRCDSGGGGDGRRSRCDDSTAGKSRRRGTPARAKLEATFCFSSMRTRGFRPLMLRAPGPPWRLVARAAVRAAPLDGAVPLWGRVFVHVFSAFYFTVANLGAGAFLFTTRENFDAAGGFDEQLFAGEEIYFSQALKKLGRFRVLAEPVVTSGRKLRMYSARQILGLSVGIVLRGNREFDRAINWIFGTMGNVKRKHATRFPGARLDSELHEDKSLRLRLVACCWLCRPARSPSSATDRLNSRLPKKSPAAQPGGRFEGHRQTDRDINAAAKTNSADVEHHRYQYQRGGPTLEQEKSRTGLSFGDVYVAHSLALASRKRFNRSWL